MPILNSINQMQDQMTEWRQDLHKIPEIGLQEYETSKYIKNKLKDKIIIISSHQKEYLNFVDYIINFEKQNLTIKKNNLLK